MTGPTAFATALSTAVVRGDDGTVLGRVRDVYLRDADRDLVAVSVALGRLGLRTVLVPATAFTVGATDETHHGMVLRALAEVGDLRAAPEAPATLHVTPQQLQEAAEALGVAGPAPRSGPVHQAHAPDPERSVRIPGGAAEAPPG